MIVMAVMVMGVVRLVVGVLMVVGVVVVVAR